MVPEKLFSEAVKEPMIAIVVILSVARAATK